MEVSYDLFLLMFNLSLLHNREKMIDLFVAGMQAIFKPSLFLFNEKAEKSGGINFELKTGKSSYGIITVKIDEGTEKIDSVLINNAAHMLAIMLERLYLEQSLEKERDAFEDLANIKIDELSRSVKDLEEARTASINLIADLSAEVEKRKMTEEALRENEERFRRVFEEGQFSMALVGEKFRFLQVNNAFCDMIGYSEEEILSFTFKDITHPEHVSGDLDSIKNLHAGIIQVYQTEKKYIRKDKKIVWGSVNISCIRDREGKFMYFLAMIDDITIRKTSEEELKKNQIILKATINSPAGMIILAIDKDYNYLSFNDVHKATMKSAYGKDVALGMNLLECITSDEDIIISKENYGRALRGESHSTIQEYGDKIRTYYETNYSPFYNENGEIIGTTAFARDITDRKEAENKILDQLNELRRWNEVTLDREDRILELKKEVNELMIKTGNPVRYESAKSEGSD